MRPQLIVTDLSVHYGGVAAVSAVSLDVGPGELVGLIGPNGAGKTSLIDAVCGFARHSGDVSLGGSTLNGYSPQRRNRAGIGRTWQTADLFDELTVLENLAMSASRKGLFALLGDVLVSAGRSDRIREAERALATMGIEELADRMPDSLSQGQRKLVDVARAVAGSATVLCLDEPAAGLDSTESALLGTRLREIVGAGTGMLLVDHDMGLVLSVCDRIVVLDFGTVIAAGPPGQIRSDERVIAAYIGTDVASTEPAAEPGPRGAGNLNAASAGQGGA